MLITPLFVRSSLLLKVIVLSTNVDYPFVCPFVLFTEGYCVVHQCWLPHCVSIRLFYLRLLYCSPMLITPLFVRSSFILKVIVLSINVDYPIVCSFVLFTEGYCIVHQCWLPHCVSIRLLYLRLLWCPSMLITPLFVRSSFLLKVIVLSINVDYPIVYPCLLFTYGYCVVHQCWLSHCLSFRPFYLRLLCCPPMLITPLFVRWPFFWLKVIVLSTNADYPIVCPFVSFT